MASKLPTVVWLDMKIWSLYIGTSQSSKGNKTYPNNGVEFSHGDLLGALHRGGHLLLMLLRQERQDLRYDGV